MYILDTNVVSEARRAASGKADIRVTSWLRGVAVNSLFLSAIVVLELELGVCRIERRDTVQGAALRSWLDDQVLKTFADRILVVDSAVARECARLHVPDPRADRDALIAATAIVHGMTVVTRNTANFEPTGVALINPWQHRE
ncbi:type II toxin-antitoxin system VapC family toxin [Salinisphaera aquimarina]|uniref:Type II toxin-antitoxin system VapC family toxin n=1 Tax=Salinisphaera aquimarina TaxID=2094031 RepID=A0ABV7EW02_9GAMM